MNRLLICALAVVCASACVRKGKAPRLSGAAWVRLFAQYDRVVSDNRIDDLDNKGSVGVSARGLLGSRLAYCAGFDANAGGGDAAFSYEANLYLLGGGVRLGKAAQLAVCAGIGLSGAAGALPFSWQVPVEASLSFDIGRRVRPSVWARGVWLLGSSLRRDGSSSLDQVDELSASVGLRVGKQRRWGRVHTGNGYYVGLTYTEQAAAKFVGVTIGHGINAGN